MTENIEKNHEEKTPDEGQPSRSFAGIFIFILTLILFAGAAGYGYFELYKINLSLAKNMSLLEKRFEENKNEIAALQQSLVNAQETIQKASGLSQQQEKLISDWKDVQKGNTDKWRIAEAQFLTKMAQDYLQFFNNVKLALALTQEANALLENLQDAQLLEIRSSLTRDITNLQALPSVDTTGLFLKLNALDNQIDKLPLPKTALDNSQENTAPAVSSSLPWWKAGLEYTRHALNQIVIVRKTTEQALPLALPEQKQALYQQLHAQKENAVWGLLHNDNDVYQMSLKNMQTLIKQYFVQGAQETQGVLQQLEEMQKAKISMQSFSLAETLKQFDNYFAQIKAAQ